MSVLGIVPADRPCWVLDLGSDDEPHVPSYIEAQEFVTDIGDVAYADRRLWALPYAPHPDQLALFEGISRS